MLILNQCSEPLLERAQISCVLDESLLLQRPCQDLTHDTGERRVLGRAGGYRSVLTSLLRFLDGLPFLPFEEGLIEYVVGEIIIPRQLNGDVNLGVADGLEAGALRNEFLGGLEREPDEDKRLVAVT